MRQIQGLRSARKRNLLWVNEHFEHERNAEIAHRAQPTRRNKFKVAIYEVSSRLGFDLTPQFTRSK